MITPVRRESKQSHYSRKAACIIDRNHNKKSNATNAFYKEHSDYGGYHNEKSQ
jgi:hypothetical protein